MVFSCRNRNIYYASRELLLVVDRAVIMVHSFFSRTFQCLIVCSQLFLVPFRITPLERDRSPTDEIRPSSEAPVSRGVSEFKFKFWLDNVYTNSLVHAFFENYFFLLILSRVDDRQTTKKVVRKWREGVLSRSSTYHPRTTHAHSPQCTNIIHHEKI
jgi:hypothetical protein